MRDRAVHHLLQRPPVPGGRAGGRPAAPAPRSRGRVPGRADLLRPDPVQHRLPRRVRAARPAVRAGVRRVRRRRDAVAIVRGDGPPPPPADRARDRRHGLGGGRRRGRPAGVRPDRVPGRRPGRDRRRRPFPAHRGVPPDLPLGPTARDRRPAAAAPRGRRRPQAGRAPGCRRVLRVRRDVRGQERGHLGGDGSRQGRRDPLDRRRGAHVGRHVVPDAPRRADRRARRAGQRVMHLAEILAGDEA